jgi:hypothetical protein
MFHILKLKTSSKCALVHIELSSTCVCLRCSCIILLSLKKSWTPLHEILHYLSMFLDTCFTFPTGILNRVSLPFYQIFKICLSLGVLANSSINDLVHLWLFNYRNLFNPLNFLLVLCFSDFICSVRIQICYVEYG